jgi:hypothetical protein
MGSRLVFSAGFARLGLGLAFALSVALAPLSCEQASTEETPTDTNIVKLGPAERLVRISMALRGTRPDSEELEAVRRDSKALPGIVDGYLRSDGFGEMIRDLHDQALDVAVPAAIYPAGFAAVGPLAGEDVQRINVSITEAPLRLIEHVIVEDRPYTEIVTADYTLADGAVAAVWGLQYGGTGRSWEVTHWADGRPSAGILSDSMLFTRHSTTFSNKNRGRANAVARALLCYDFIDRQIEIDANIDLSNPDEVANAIQNNATCASCHQTLDPLAAYFSKYQPLFVPSQADSYPLPFYTPELARVFSVRDAGYFGYPGSDVAHLGQMMAQDPRFSACAARRFYAYFHQIPLADVPAERAAQLQSVLVRNWSAKELIRSIVLADDFAVSHVEVDDPERDRHALFKARPWQLARLIADLTGFRWEMDFDFDIGWGRIGHVDLMTDAFLGFEVLSGGIDGVNVTLPSHTMNASSSIVLDALAAQAAEQVVENDFQWLDSRKLLTRIALDDTSEGAVREQLSDLQGRLFGTLAAADSADTTRAWQLYQAALGEAGGDAKRAWKTVLYAMLQDPKVVYY